MADFPALPLWTDAYLADTTHLSATESGAYLHLLMAAWRTQGCCLPYNDRQLARMAKCSPKEWKRVRDVVLAFWVVDESAVTISQKRLTSERIRVLEKSQDQARKANLKWLKERQTRHAVAYAEPMPEPMPNASPDDASISRSISIEEPSGSSSPPNPPNVDVRVKEPKSDGRKRPAKPIPADWKPDQADNRAARELGLSYADIAIEAGKFRDYCLAHDKRYVDFAAAWRNWCASPYRRGGAPKVNGNGGGAAEALAAHRERDRRGILAALAPELDNRGAAASDGDGGASAGSDGADDF